ncbi:Aspartokinase, partial [Irineochytrium annulatum]
LRLVNRHVRAIHRADPRIVPTAQRIERMEADEAAECSIMGIGIHLVDGGRLGGGRRDVDVRVVGDEVRHGEGGTLIVPAAPVLNPPPAVTANLATTARSPATAVVYRRGIATLTVRSTIGVGDRNGGDVIHLIASTFAAMERLDVKVCAVSTSLRAIAVAVVAPAELRVGLSAAEKHHRKTLSATAAPVDLLDRARDALSSLGAVTLHRDRAMVTLVGRSKGADVSGRMVRAVEGAGLKIDMCTRGVAGTGLSVVVDVEDVGACVRVVHAAFFSGEEVGTAGGRGS